MRRQGWWNRWRRHDKEHDQSQQSGGRHGSSAGNVISRFSGSMWGSPRRRPLTEESANRVSHSFSHGLF